MRPALIFIISTIAQLYLLVMLLRFWLPWLRIATTEGSLSTMPSSRT